MPPAGANLHAVNVRGPRSRHAFSSSASSSSSCRFGDGSQWNAARPLASANATRGPAHTSQSFETGWPTLSAWRRSSFLDADRPGGREVALPPPL
ncbi:hypothetical protein MTO96_015603 [Rhipicephalus appendiculatus]